MEFTVKRPQSLLKPLDVPTFGMFGAGPANVPDRVSKAMALPVMSPICGKCFEIMDEIKDGLKYIFQTQNPVTFAVTGSGNAGMETALTNLAERGETVLIATQGAWGVRAVLIARQIGLNVIELKREWGSAFTLEELESALRKHRPVCLFIVQGESSTGVLQPVEELGELCHKYNCLFILDAIIPLGTSPVFVDKWSVDCAIGGTQKGLSAPPGLSPITFSQRAMDRIQSRKTQVPSHFFDVIKLGTHWGCFPDRPRLYHHTLPVHMYYGLRETLAMIAEEGLENVHKRHRQCTEEFIKKIQELGMECFVKDEKLRLPGIITVTVEGIDLATLYLHIYKRYNTEIGQGIGLAHGKILRVGFLGQNAKLENVEWVLKVLKEGIEYAKTHKADPQELAENAAVYGFSVQN